MNINNFYFGYHPNLVPNTIFYFIPNPAPLSPNPHPINNYTVPALPENPFSYNLQTPLTPLTQNPTNRPEIEHHHLQTESDPFNLRQGELSLESIEKKRRGKVEAKSVESAMKNSGANLSNNFFSFMKSLQNAIKLVEKIFRALGILLDDNTLLSIIEIGKYLFELRKKKYINLAFCRQLGNPEFIQEHLPKLQAYFGQKTSLTLENFCKFYNRILFYYFRSISTLSILTSKKVIRVAKKKHLERIRVYIESLQE